MHLSFLPPTHFLVVGSAPPTAGARRARWWSSGNKCQAREERWSHKQHLAAALGFRGRCWCATALWPKWHPIPRCPSVSHVTLWMRREKISEMITVLCCRFTGKANHLKYVNSSDFSLGLSSNFTYACTTWAFTCSLFDLDMWKSTAPTPLPQPPCHRDWDHSSPSSSLCILHSWKWINAF